MTYTTQVRCSTHCASRTPGEQGHLSRLLLDKVAVAGLQALQYVPQVSNTTTDVNVTHNNIEHSVSVGGKRLWIKCCPGPERCMPL